MPTMNPTDAPQKSLAMILDQIEERASKATPGPWHRGRADATLVFRSPDTLVTDCTSLVNLQRRERLDNAAFIAASRTDVVLLVKALRRAMQVIAHFGVPTTEAEIKDILEGKEA